MFVADDGFMDAILLERVDHCKDPDKVVVNFFPVNDLLPMEDIYANNEGVDDKYISIACIKKDEDVVLPASSPLY